MLARGDGISGAVNNPFFNTSEGRIRSLLRVLVQIAVFFTLVSCFRSLEDSLIHSLTDKTTAATILAFDSSQFVVMLLSFVGSIYLCARFLDKRRFSDLGPVLAQGVWIDYVYGFVIALLLVGTMLIILLACGAAAISSVNTSSLHEGKFLLGIADGLLACMMIGFQEELLRFYQIKNLSEGLSGFPNLGKKGAIICATILASVFFGCLHMPNNAVTPQAILLLILDGIFLSLVYISTGRGWLAFGFHTGWDFAEGNIFGFPVSGYPEAYSLINCKLSGPAIITGGAFGPDGGLINFVMIMLGTLGIIAWIYCRDQGFHLKLDLCDWQKNN